MTTYSEKIWQDTYDMDHATNVAQETTLPSMMTAPPSALDADTAAVEQQATLFYLERQKRKARLTAHHQTMQAALSQMQLFYSSSNMESPSQKQHKGASSGQNESNNLSLPTETKKEDMPVFKAGTLTLTGQVNPNILTVDQVPKSSRSTKRDKHFSSLDW